MNSIAISEEAQRQNWPLTSLGSLCAQKTGTVNPSNTPDRPFVYVDIASIDNKSKTIVEPQHLMGSEAPSRARRSIRTNDVIVSMTRPNLNAVALVSCEFNEQVCSTGFCVLRAGPRILPDFIFHFVRSRSFINSVSGLVSGALYPAVTEDQIRNLPIPLPPLDEQRRIVGILDHATSIRRLREQAQAKVRQIIPALFVDMFGDPATNPKGYDVAELDSVADIKSGLTKGRKLNEKDIISLPYLRVANVQDGRLDLSEIKHIDVMRDEVDRFLLRRGDLVMTEGGDPDKLGRSAIWRNEVEICVHQNHVFRVRPLLKFVLSDYLCALSCSGYGKGYFLSVAKRTTGIASINRTQLGRFPILMAPIALQQEFAERVSEIEAMATLGDTATQGAERLAQSLMSQVFGQAAAPM